MIPKEIFTYVRDAVSYNHGARLARGNESYDLKKESGVIATVFIRCTVNELPALEKKGYEISKGSERYQPLAWKRISPSQVPQSNAGDWETWDEY